MQKKHSYTVLVMGYRQGLARALQKLGVPFAIWSEDALKTPPDCLHLHVEEFPRDDDALFDILDELNAAGPFSHVIAGSEASVYPAAIARRYLRARTSVKTVALRCHDKLQMKSYLHERGIAMTDFVAGDEIDDADAVLTRLGSPLVIKSRHESGGRGIHLVENAQDLIRYSGRSKIIEKFVQAPEASVESFIIDGEIRFTNVTQYYVKKHINLVPGHLSVEQRQALLELNRQVIAALRIDWGMTHLEAYLDEDGILFGEIALRPPGGYIMELISRAYGFSSWEALLHVELDLPFTFEQSNQRHTAVYIIHPGAGRVKQIECWNDVASMAGVFRARLKVEAGDVISMREGVGEDAGFLLLENNKANELLIDIQTIVERFKIILH